MMLFIGLYNHHSALGQYLRTIHKIMDKEQSQKIKEITAITAAPNNLFDS